MSDDHGGFAESKEMEQRNLQASDFYNRILDDDERPMFCSDDACFLDLYVGSLQEAKDMIHEKYNIFVTDEDLKMPFWKLLDLLYTN